MHPLCITIIRRPDLVMDHLGAYAALLTQEASQASHALVTRALVWFVAILSLAICIVLSGTALMFGILQNQFHWILVAVPGAMALCALVAFTMTKQTILANRFTNIKSQLLSDAAALRAAAGNQVN
jgi:cytochrome bd-type quinol oxidase subunit 2